MNVQHKNIRRANLGEVVHNRRDPLLLDHSADGDPAVLLEGGDGGGALAGGDLCRVDELGAGNVVLAEDVLLGRDDAVDAGGNEVDHGWVGGGL